MYCFGVGYTVLFLPRVPVLFRGRVHRTVFASGTQVWRVEASNGIGLNGPTGDGPDARYVTGKVWIESFPHVGHGGGFGTSGTPIRVAAEYPPT